MIEKTEQLFIQLARVVVACVVALTALLLLVAEPNYSYLHSNIIETTVVKWTPVFQLHTTTPMGEAASTTAGKVKSTSTSLYHVSAEQHKKQPPKSALRRIKRR